MTNSLTHFEIYGEQPTALAEFYHSVFGWQVEQMEMVDYWRITTGTAESKTLNGGLTYRALPDLNGWMLYVQVPALDEPVEIVKSLGGSVVRPKTAVPRAAWVTILRDPAKKKKHLRRVVGGPNCLSSAGARLVSPGLKGEGKECIAQIICCRTEMGSNHASSHENCTDPHDEKQRPSEERATDP